MVDCALKIEVCILQFYVFFLRLLYLSHKVNLSHSVVLSLTGVDSAPKRIDIYRA